MVFDRKFANLWASLMAQTAKSLLTKQETRVQCLGSEDPLEKGVTTHSNILAWRIPQALVHGVTELHMTE